MALKWSENWGRSYRISIGTREYKKYDFTIEERTVIQSPLRLADDTYEVIPSNARVMANLVSEGYDKRGFSFELDTSQSLSSNSKDAEQSVLKLYNLDKDLIDIINQEECVVIVEAGYEDKVELIYSGDVQEVRVQPSGADTVYSLICVSGGYAMRNTLSSIDYPPELPLRDVIIDMIGRFPATSVGTVALSQQDSRVKRVGHQALGLHVESFEEFMQNQGLNWAHFNGKIIITPYRLSGEDNTIFGRTNFNIPLNTIKEISEISDKKGNGAKSEKNNTKKIRLSTLLLPVELGQFVTIPDDAKVKQFSGTYQVQSRRVFLQSQGNAWDTVVEATLVPD